MSLERNCKFDPDKPLPKEGKYFMAFGSDLHFYMKKYPFRSMRIAKKEHRRRQRLNNKKVCRMALDDL